MKQSAYSVSKLRRRIQQLESENADLRKMLAASDKSPERSKRLLRDIVLSDCMTDEGDRVFQRSLSEAIEYLEGN